jgi:hypothetical protein
VGLSEPRLLVAVQEMMIFAESVKKTTVVLQEILDCVKMIFVVLQETLDCVKMIFVAPHLPGIFVVHQEILEMIFVVPQEILEMIFVVPHLPGIFVVHQETLERVKMIFVVLQEILEHVKMIFVGLQEILESVKMIFVVRPQETLVVRPQENMMKKDGGIPMMIALEMRNPEILSRAEERKKQKDKTQNSSPKIVRNQLKEVDGMMINHPNQLDGEMLIQLLNLHQSQVEDGEMMLLLNQ